MTTAKEIRDEAVGIGAPVTAGKVSPSPADVEWLARRFFGQVNRETRWKVRKACQAPLDAAAGRPRGSDHPTHRIASWMRSKATQPGYRSAARAIAKLADAIDSGMDPETGERI